MAWISTQEAAKRLGVTTREVYRLIDEGRLAAARSSKPPLVVDAEQVEQLVASA